MRLAVISDIHGNLPALETVLADIATRSVDGTVNLGDCIAGPAWPLETYELLASLNLPTVRGNHDRWAIDRPDDQMPPAGRFARDALSLEQRTALHALPPTIDLSDTVLAVHGTPDNDSLYLLEEQLQGRLCPAARETVAERLGPAAAREVVLCGHSHRQAMVQAEGGCMILNPGSVGCPVFADMPTAAAAENRSPHARYAIITRRNGRWGAEMFALEYDWNATAARAASLGFPLWAQAYATGAVS